ncbi:MAG: DUF192 domain-containing protein [Pseudomonadota bacterium]
MKNNMQMYVNGQLVLDNIRVADTVWQRFVGLIGTKEFAANDALLIMPCNSVHMFGMRYPIDVVFLTRSGTILKVVCKLKPMGIAMCAQAYQALELPAGTAVRLGLAVRKEVTLRALMD